MDQTSPQGFDGYDSRDEREQQMISRTTDNSVPHLASLLNQCNHRSHPQFIKNTASVASCAPGSIVAGIVS